jgi:hypothetical protein
VDIYEIVEQHIQQWVDRLREMGEHNKVMSSSSSGEVVTPELILKEIKDRTEKGKTFVENFVNISIELTLARLDMS